MLNIKEPISEQIEDLLVYDPFAEIRTSVRIRRAGSWYNISLIDINDNPLYYYTLICVHGWGSSCLNYRFLMTHLSPYFRIVAYDLKGHGESAKDEDSYDLGMFTEELAQVIDHIKPNSLVLVGHSMGTAIILNYLSLNQNRVKAAVILSGAANFREPLPKLLPWLIFRMDEKIKQFIVSFAMSFTSSKSVPIELKNAIKEQIAKVPYHVMRKSLLNTVFAWKRAENLRKIKTSTLLMVGEKDMLIKIRHCIELSAHLPNSRLVILPETKHDILLDKGIDVANLIHEFLEFQMDLEKIEEY